MSTSVCIPTTKWLICNIIHHNVLPYVCNSDINILSIIESTLPPHLSNPHCPDMVRDFYLRWCSALTRRPSFHDIIMFYQDNQSFFYYSCQGSNSTWNFLVFLSFFRHILLMITTDLCPWIFFPSSQRDIMH